MKARKANTKTEQPTKAEARERKRYRYEIALLIFRNFLPEIKAAALYVLEHLGQWLDRF